MIRKDQPESEDEMAAQGDKHNNSGGDQPIEHQAQQQTGQQARLHIDERNMRSSYANAFRSNGTPEEVMLDFGINVMAPPAADGQAQIVFQVSDRIVLNYYSAKRLAVALGQLIRRYEADFGELELDVNRRRRAEGTKQ